MANNDTLHQIMKGLAAQHQAMLTAIPRDKPVYYIDIPLHFNIGDLLINRGADFFFNRYGYNVAARASRFDYELVLQNIPPDATIVLHGGGNLGDLWPHHETVRQTVLKNFPAHKIVIMPQSIHFNNADNIATLKSAYNNHRDLTLYVRDHFSLDFARRNLTPNTHLMPDMAHQLWHDDPLLPWQTPGQGTLILGRKDREATPNFRNKNTRAIDWSDNTHFIDYAQMAILRGLMIVNRIPALQPPMMKLWHHLRDKMIQRHARVLTQGDHLVTDRLHGMIIGHLLDKEVTIMDNNYGKLSRYIDAWLPNIVEILPPLGDLQRVDTKPIPTDSSDIRLFAVVRDEMLRLPYFLDYYRRLGVKSFFIVSNDSTDGTTEFLAAQPDCFVFHTKSSYAAAHYGIDWQNDLLMRYGVGHWTILADADELLTYPQAETASLPKLCAWLDQHHYKGLYALMLDMYSAAPLSQVHYQQGTDFLSACSTFDRDYAFVPRLKLPFTETFPDIEPIGGPRARLCFPDQNTASAWPRLSVKLIANIGRALGIPQSKLPTVLPLSYKIPLIKCDKTTRFINIHRSTPVRLAPLTGAILHFKYFQDFNARIADAIARKSHYDNSSEYRRYAEIFVDNKDLSFTYGGSTPYTGSADLIHLGLMNPDSNWKPE